MTVDGGEWDVSNQSQVWSDLIQGDVNASSGSPGTALFDGVIGPGFANGVTAGTGQSLLLDFGTTFDSASTVTIYGYTGRVQNNEVLKINGTSVDIPPYGVDNDRSVTYTLPQAGLQTIEWTYVDGNSFIYMHAIEVDGKILIDAVNDSQVWSDNTTGVWTSPATLAFDGDLDATGAYSDGSPGTINFTGLDSVTKIRIYGSEDSLGTAWNITTNENTYNPADLGWAQGSFNWAEIPGTELISITNNNGQGQLRAVEIDGQLLIDTGTDRGLGDTEVTGPAKSGVGIFVSTNDTDEIVLKDSNDQWIDNGDFFAKEMNAFLKSGNARDEAEYQAIADAFAAYPGKVTTRQNNVAAALTAAQSALTAEQFSLIQEELDN